MPVEVIKHMQKTASQMACNSALYNWSLKGHIPENLRYSPVDHWPGNKDGARFLCNGSLVIDDAQSDLHQGWHILRLIAAQGWGVCADAAPTWYGYAHGFTWLRCLKALGGDLPRRQARAMIEAWINDFYKWDEQSWEPSLLGQRLSMWIALYDSFGESAEDHFQARFLESVSRQARHLSRILPGETYGLDLLKAAKGLLYAGLAFEGHESMIEQALSIFHHEIPRQILGDGGHVSRSPAQLLEVFQILLDVRSALKGVRYPVPAAVQHAIDRMGPALRFFRYNDKSFALFHGAQEGNQEFVDYVLSQANVRGKALKSLPATGYLRMAMGRSLVMFECGKSPETPYDRYAHASPLAFEMAYGKERIFVSCGSHPASENWREALRVSAAHSTLSIDGRDACEIVDSGHFERRVKNISLVHEENKEAVLAEASHDGYVSLNGITHRRRLYLGGKGYDFRGEDILSRSSGAAPAKQFAIRFHIHPRVIISLVQNGSEAFLRLSNGVGWRFKHSGGKLALEDSIYLGEGVRPRKTKQLVIYGTMNSDFAQVKWSLSKEG